MSVNPYEPPLATAAEEAPLTIAVEPFDISQARFVSRSFTRESFRDALRSEIGGACRDQGLYVVPESEASLRVVGAVLAVDEGSQIMRYLFPFLAGASLVHVAGEMQFRGGASRPFQEIRRSHMGAFGGRGETLIRLAITRIALAVAADAATALRPNIPGQPSHAGRYLLSVFAAALILSLLATGAGYGRIASTPDRAMMGMEAMIARAAVGGAATFFSVLLTGVALAPKPVLYSRALLWLVSISGTRSTTGVRILLLIFASLPTALLAVFILDAIS
jgi:hypothetical protein